MEIDTITLRTAQRRFESKSHSNLNDLGLSKSARRKLMRYRKVPSSVTDANEAQELLYISFEYNNILNDVMKPPNAKSKFSQKPKNYSVFS